MRLSHWSQLPLIPHPKLKRLLSAHMFIEDAYYMNLRLELCDLDMTPFSAVYFPNSHSIVSVQTALPASNNKLDRASGKVMTSSIHTYIHTYLPTYLPTYIHTYIVYLITQVTEYARPKSWCGPAYLLFKNQSIHMWINRKSTEIE